MALIKDRAPALDSTATSPDNSAQRHKTMDVSDTMSTTSGSLSPSPSHAQKAPAKRGRPRLTEDAELAKLVCLSDRQGARF